LLSSGDGGATRPLLRDGSVEVHGIGEAQMLDNPEGGE